MVVLSEWHPIEEFDKTWPYTLAWGYSAQKDRAHAWKIPQGDDGSLLHRDQFAQHFGHPPQTRQGDQLGTAQFTPEETKWDGTAVAPAEMLLHTYYSAKPEDQVYEWFTEHFPDVIVRQAYVGKPKTAANKPLAWTWTEEEGPVLGRKDTHPKAWTGRVEFGPTVRIIPDRPDTPGHALSAIKTEVAKHHPDSEIGLPSATKPSTNPVSLLDRAAAVEWAYENLHREAAPVVDYLPTIRPPKRGLFSRFKRQSDADMDGAMVAIFIPEEVAKKIKVRGGEEVSNMHVTLVYFTDKAADRDDWDEVAKICETIANQTAPLSGKVGGVGVFQNDDGDVLWASPSIPGLAELRQKVVEACEDAGFNVSDEHGWVPHITLKYKHRGKLPKLDADLELDIAELSFAQGEKKEHFKLDGEFVKETSWEMKEWKWPGTVRFVTDGKEILTEPENQPEWDSLDLTTLQQKFHSFYPDVKKVPACGWAIPTADGMGYGIWAPSIGYGNDKQLGLHDLVHTLDRELGKPTHFVEDWDHITDPKMYSSNHPD